jgi:pimeloyl-ACP methyl ester carboxylesterase
MRLRGWFDAADGTRVWYGLQGQGPTIVLCDGVGCDGYVWPYLMDHFDEDFTFVRWHYRGHGNSTEPADPDHLDLPYLVEDLHGLLAALQRQGEVTLPAIFIGHSMGCQVILEYAWRFPDQVRALIPVCGSYGHPLDTFLNSKAFRSFFSSLLGAVDRAPGVANAIWSRGFTSPLSWPIAARTEVNAALVSRAEFMPYLKHMGRISPATFLRMLHFAARHTTEPWLPQIKAPALVVAAENDNFTPMYLSERMVGLLPDAELFVIPEGTHTAPLERPDLLNEVVERFFQARGLRP